MQNWIFLGRFDSASEWLSHLYLIYVIVIMASKYLLLYQTCQACDLLYFDTLFTITPLNKVTKKNLLIFMADVKL